MLAGLADISALVGPASLAGGLPIGSTAWAWAGAGNGVLVLDLDGDGKIGQKDEYRFLPVAEIANDAIKEGWWYRKV
ncbi:hypothetical protein [Labrys sp. 22185]|uniref:hypothetical protein n=1 Tax=Labrys sp. 22185 TaxID=3453888 RepID=UPI003F87A046